jgi:hypothetical protein
MTGFGKDRFRDDQVQRLDNKNREAEYVVAMGPVLVLNYVCT